MRSFRPRCSSVRLVRLLNADGIGPVRSFVLRRSLLQVREVAYLRGDRPRKTMLYIMLCLAVPSAAKIQRNDLTALIRLHPIPRPKRSVG